MHQVKDKVVDNEVAHEEQKVQFQRIKDHHLLTRTVGSFASTHRGSSSKSSVLKSSSV